MNARYFFNASVAILVVVSFFVCYQTANAGPCQVVTTQKVVAAPAYSVNGSFAIGNSHVVSSGYYNQFVPIVQSVQVVPDFFYSSAHYARDEALLEALKIIKESRGSNASKVEQKRSVVDDGFGGALDGIPEIGGKVSLGGSSSELQGLVESKCIRCHNGSKGHLDLTNLNGLSPNVKISVYEAVADGSMPPNGSLSKDQKRVFREWAIAK